MFHLKMKNQDESQSQMRKRHLPVPEARQHCRCSRLHFASERWNHGLALLRGKFSVVGEGRVYSKNILQRGELICSIKPKLECRENVFAHNTGLIRLNQNAHICISTQDYFNPTCFFKYTPNFHRSFNFCYFFF